MNILKILIYSTDSGKEPFSDWEESLDKKTRAIIQNRLDRVRLGNLGDAKALKNGDGVWELRIDFGPGYRVYFGKEGSTIVVLLAGGNKQTQDRDIVKSKQYWLQYRKEKE
jgi:putative addiction module killer protein